ncbi:uncharacterized protein LOC129004206 [Macrosteles quadrilineatus]|uniref:uncharacterized protein LOC129004206 n=1 Tax=Macrosteles quadrilineatus TaxID=74068 RepID=UPI0023E2792A|nr:uncharacterized protein LOC129004206 [Macrosteles quadrilineatus]
MKIPWEEQLEIIKNLYAQRMKTTYYVSFCEKKAKKEINSQSEDDEDTLLSTADKLYSPKSQKTLLPIPTSRRVLGYSRPAYYYMGRSEYQDEFGKFGYGQLMPSRGQRLKQRLNFCDMFTTKH